MSQSSMSEITCPACGSKHEFKVWDSINTKQDPELKEAVRTGMLSAIPAPTAARLLS